ncbi:hypothetical protein RUND412_002883 [Rhizina undulata]
MLAIKLFHITLRLLQFLWVLLVLALSGALIEQQTLGGTPTRVNYSIFVAAFAMLTLFYLIPATFMEERLANWGVMAALDAVNVVFFLAAGIAVAAELGGGDCGDVFYLHTNGITNGGGYISPRRRCMEAQSMTVFHWFAFASFLASMMICLYIARYSSMWTGRHKTTNARMMSQV